MTNEFLAFCRSRKYKPYLRKVTKDALNWESALAYPSGSWSKGHTTLILHRWFLDFCEKRPGAVASNELLRLAYAAAKAMHFLLEELYRRDLWILAPEAISVSSLCKMHEAAAVCAL